MTTATWNDATIAESDATVVVERNVYFPRDAVDMTMLEDSGTTSHCPWKGTARYYTVCVDGKRNLDAAWYYPEPLPAAKAITGHIAFWKGVRVD